MATQGAPPSVVPASRTRAIPGCSISASACRSTAKRAATCAGTPVRMTFTATRRRMGADCSAAKTRPIPPSPSSPVTRYGPMAAGHPDPGSDLPGPLPRQPAPRPGG